MMVYKMCKLESDPKHKYRVQSDPIQTLEPESNIYNPEKIQLNLRRH